MTDDSPENDTAGGIVLRRALYGGLFGSVGATAGWLTWISFQVGWRVLLAPVIGVILEFIRKGYEYHQRVAASESATPKTPYTQESVRTNNTHTSLRASLGRVVWFSFPILLAIVLGVAADLIKEIIVPYLQSVITIFPVGAIFALWFYQGQFRPHNLPERIGLGAIGGMLATLASLLIFYAIGGKAGIANIQSSWWVLVGICFAIAHVDEVDSGAPAIIAPLVSVTLLLLLIALFVAFNFDRYAYAGIKVIPSTINAVLAGPDLPATSWKDVRLEKEIRNTPTPEGWTWLSRASGCESLQPLRISRERILAGCEDASVIAFQCAVPPCLNLEKDCSIQSLMTRDRSPQFEIEGSEPAAERAQREQRVAMCKVRREECEEAIERIKADVANPSSQSVLAREAQANELQTAPQIYRRRLLCRQVSLEWRSGLVRSLLAIVLFGVFWGAGRSLEVSHRPAHYATSRTRRLELLVVGLMGLLTIVVIIISRLR